MDISHVNAGVIRHGFPVSERQQMALIKRMTDNETSKTGKQNVSDYASYTGVQVVNSVCKLN
jgi:hypothetical protein